MLAAMATEQVRTEKMAAGGDAIAHLDDGRIVFVDGALVDEVVEVAVHTSKRDFAKATVVQVLEASPHRVAPPCPGLARGCGGCGWQHASAEAQLQWKADVVRDALRRTARLPDARVSIGGAVPPWGYRTSLRLAVGAGGRVGLRSARSHDVVALDACPVANPALESLLADVRVRDADELSLRVSATTGEATAMASRSGATLDGLPPHVAVGPDAVLHEHVLGTRLRVTAAAFFQSGPAAAELLVDTVRAMWDDLLGSFDGRLLDAYGGGGLFSAGLGIERSILVESSPAACADARLNVPTALVHEMRFEQWRPEPVDLVIADPARAGLGREAVEIVARTGSPCVLLVSCDPVAMARDTALLVEHGYRHRDSQVLDLFPHTPHVEVVTRFDR